MLEEQQDSATMAHVLEGRVVSRLEKVPHKGGPGDGIDDNVEGVGGRPFAVQCMRIAACGCGCGGLVGSSQSVGVHEYPAILHCESTYFIPSINMLGFPSPRGSDADALVLINHGE